MAAGPSRSTRRPAVAGLFYPADQQQCAAAAEQYLRASRSAPAHAGEPPWRGGIVPHAGWVCSGAIAGETIATIEASRDAAGMGEPDVVVVFGAVHTALPLDHAALGSHERWEVPGGVSPVPTELSGKLESDQSNLFAVDDRFHLREHAVEVELPLIQRAWPDAFVLPVEVPLIEEAERVGRQTARMIQAMGLDALYLASSDLTHYGPAYDFAPAGVGLEGLEWARANDRRLLDVVQALSVEAVVPEVRERASACGGGAISAMMAACREHGASRATVLRHANSYEVLKEVVPGGQRPDNAVGYAAVVVG
jgi:MEMO1 family protein